jgi:hypothetical protein
MAAFVFPSFILGLKMKSRVLLEMLELAFPALHCSVTFTLFKALQTTANCELQSAPLSSSFLFAKVAFTQL